MKLNSVGLVVATRELQVQGGVPIQITLGKPEKFPSGTDYYCPYQIVGLGDDAVRYAGGVDAIQALLLTLRKIGAVLYTSDGAKAGAMTWDGGSQPGDLGFPLPDVISDLVPK